MKKISAKPLSEVHKMITTGNLVEQNITSLEIDSMEQKRQLTDLEIAVMELQQKE